MNQNNMPSIDSHTFALAVLAEATANRTGGEFATILLMDFVYCHPATPKKILDKEEQHIHLN